MFDRVCKKNKQSQSAGTQSTVAISVTSSVAPHRSRARASLSICIFCSEVFDVKNYGSIALYVSVDIIAVVTQINHECIVGIAHCVKV